jgi:phosphatidate cytidylyltransferase
MLKTRIVTAVCLLAGLLGALFFLPDVGWAVFCALICAGAAWEWGGLAGWNGKARVAYGVALGASCFILASGLSGYWPEWQFAFLDSIRALVLFAMAFWLLVVPFWLKYKWRLGKWSAAVVGCIVLLPPFLVFIVLRDLSPVFALMAVAPVWVADIAAYFSGRAFGRKKLAPSISPGKTWAGAVGAALGVMVYGGIVFAVIMFDSGFTFSSFKKLAAFLVLGIVFTALSIEGDLFESLLKRHADVKDSGNFLPGHGGILDRIDSLTSTLSLLPVVMFILLSLG